MLLLKLFYVGKGKVLSKDIRERGEAALDNTTWNAIGAIGQWAGAIATFIAVLVALQQNKPRVKILLKKIPSDLPGISNFSLKFIVVNKKAIPVAIKETSFMNWRGKRVIMYNYFAGRGVPKTLNTSESIELEISDNELSNRLKDEGYKGKILLKLFIMDSSYRFQYKYFLFDIDKKTIIAIML